MRKRILLGAMLCLSACEGGEPPVPSPVRAEERLLLQEVSQVMPEKLVSKLREAILKEQRKAALQAARIIARQATNLAACVGRNTLRTCNFEPKCSGGTCSYPYKDTRCKWGCEAGRCKHHPCAMVRCYTPPQNRCLGGRVLRAYGRYGRCIGGVCKYPTKDIRCPVECSGGTCTSVPCKFRNCISPPPNQCMGGKTLRVYEKWGKCVGGVCKYSARDIPCPVSCIEGRCKYDSCAGVHCSLPPSDYCEGRKTMVKHNAFGVCIDGSCSHIGRYVRCPAGCANGACKKVR